MFRAASRVEGDGCGSWLPYEPKCFSVASPIPKERSEAHVKSAPFSRTSHWNPPRSSLPDRRRASIYATIIIKRPPQKQTAGQRLHTDRTYSALLSWEMDCMSKRGIVRIHLRSVKLPTTPTEKASFISNHTPKLTYNRQPGDKINSTQ
jgi:hypothetical protein